MGVTKRLANLSRVKTFEIKVYRSLIDLPSKKSFSRFCTFKSCDLRLTSVQMPARIGWFFQEVPAFLVGLVGNLYLVEIQEIYSALSLIPFTLHYFNRSVIFPLSIKQG